MGQYSKKGLYSAYDKNHKERQKEDYYSTPTEEVVNILNVMQLPLQNATVLEPSCGGGHMIEGIGKFTSNIIGTDIKDRGYTNPHIELQYGLDYLADDYPYDVADYVIMNPPFKLIEPFVIRSLEIAQKGVLMFGRLQFLEGEGRFKTIFSIMPPTDVYVYVDRVACFKNGDTSIKPDSVQAYAWYYWDKTNNTGTTKIHWLRRNGK
jgi:hypothetical protein